MVELRIDEPNHRGMIVLRPNQPASWDFNLFIIVTSVMLAAFISFGFYVQGFWMILPFSGLEVLALAACLYLVYMRSQRTEVISFDEHTVVVESGRYEPEESKTYQRPWSKIYVKEPTFRSTTKKVVIRSHGEEQELGSFLNPDDKEQLITALKKIIYA